ncbi:MAG: PhnD/SsuA/transferrin family substrate-binding protein [Pseudomonadota bacterium]
MPNLQTAIFVLACCFAVIGGAVADTPQRVRVAVLADKGVEAAEEEWDYVLDWLNHDVPGYEFVIVAFDHPELREAVHAGNVDFLITNAGNYGEFEYSEGVSRIATLDSPLALSPSRAVGSAVVVRGDSGLTELAQLRGKHLLAASHDAFCCYQIAARELVEAGVDPEKDLGELEFTGFPIQSIARAVRDGKADAGFLKTCLLEQMIDSGALKAGELRVLNPQDIPGYPCQTTSRLYPDWAFAALKGTATDLSRKVTVSLLEMPSSPEGYRWAIPAHYAVLDELFRDLKLGRYANLQEVTLTDLVSRHRYTLLVIALLIVLLLIHTIRVDYLVTRRTRELQRAHQEKEDMAEAMRERQQALDHSSRLAVLGSMASAIAHELKQPLAAIDNFARGIDRRIAAGRLEPEPLRDGCNEITLQSQRADATIERIRNFARKGSSTMQSVNLLAYVREAVELFEVAHPEANIQWLSMNRQDDTRVKADPIQIQQVTFNLLKNAIDAQSMQGRARAAITVSLEREGAGYRVGVRDQGGNLTEEQVAHLFEPFFTTKSDGLGLGLALSKWIIDAHGGTLKLTRETAGVCASFWLPEEQLDE